jgi:hypothetical protein
VADKVINQRKRKKKKKEKKKPLQNEPEIGYTHLSQEKKKNRKDRQHMRAVMCGRRIAFAGFIRFTRSVLQLAVEDRMGQILRSSQKVRIN